MKEFTIRPLFDIYSIGLYSEDRLCSPLGTNLGIRDTEDTNTSRCTKNVHERDHLALYEIQGGTTKSPRLQ
jgi:hypothetical protein